ncbi:protein of unknown function (plasmid) [Cupriavidus neocaledonicus]|uniref:Uncharacterized protein n=1 Tax=Cupriavidus neocaledonicus TaxID=1040979 RepID=A0A375HSU7_9BURK|nr:protein of unknown function [Cupriavidus neocaledonicus]
MKRAADEQESPHGVPQIALFAFVASRSLVALPQLLLN